MIIQLLILVHYFKSLDHIHTKLSVSSKLSYKHIFLYSNNKTKRFLPLRMMEHITRIFCNDTMICTYVTKCLSLIFFLNRDSDELTFLLIWLKF